MELYDNFKSRTLDRKAHSKQKKLFMSVKRMIDILISLVLIILLSPLFIFITCWIYIKEGNPVFSKNTIIGKDHQPFMMREFRTRTNPSRVICGFLPDGANRIDKDGIDKYVITKQSTTVINKTGEWLVKYKFHHLPKLWNVLKGEMSLIGPRPDTRQKVKKYTTKQTVKLKVKPGIIGYSRFFGELDQVNKDILYVKKCSFILEFKILAVAVRHTVKNLLR